MKKNKNSYKVYHWDTFDNETLLLFETDSIEKAENYIKNRYNDRLSSNGADKVEIVKDGAILRSYCTT